RRSRLRGNGWTEEWVGGGRAMRLLLRAGFIAAATIGLYAGADIMVGELTGPPVIDPANVPAYRGQSYIASDFLEGEVGEPGAWRTAFGARVLEPPEFHGRYFNVDRLPPTGITYRRTANPASTRPPLIVLLLGPSTVYGPTVPDDQTLASLLSA